MHLHKVLLLMTVSWTLVSTVSGYIRVSVIYMLMDNDKRIISTKARHKLKEIICFFLDITQKLG